MKFQTGEDYTSTANDIKAFFHREGFHSTTIQLEFEREGDPTGARCMIVCSFDDNCADLTCCKPSLEELLMIQGEASLKTKPQLIQEEAPMKTESHVIKVEESMKSESQVTQEETSMKIESQSIHEEASMKTLTE